MTKVIDEFLLHINPEWKDKDIQDLLNHYNNEHIKWCKLLDIDNKRINPPNLSNRKRKQLQKIRDNIISNSNKVFSLILILEDLLNSAELRKQ